ncbi:MAG TPA: hypothetical protein P5191_06305 [Ruminococcus sp.]|nr:hypothetical protein [Ruminococcus sp.]
MTRMKISIVIMCLLIGAGIFSGISVNRSCGRLISGSDEVWELYSSGDKQGGVSAGEGA